MRIVLLVLACLAGGQAALADGVEGAWSGRRALEDIARQLSFGPRSPGIAGHDREIAFIREELAKTTASVTAEDWVFRRQDGVDLPMTNIVARFDEKNPRRVLLGTHFDSIIRAYADHQRPNAVMPGANNSASGVALLLETARVLSAAQPPSPVGVDLIFFDGEEGPLALGAGDPAWQPLGSPHLASHITRYYPSAPPEQAIIFDMVCYRQLTLKPEPLSLRSAGEQTRRFWDLGRKQASSVFLEGTYPLPIFDDQLAFARLGIPSFLVIGFDYDPYFNTTGDSLDKCAASSLESVGRTLVQYLYATDKGRHP